MKVCVIYDCLYPHTVGGAQRWYRALAERLAERGHDVTYLTLRQWPLGESAGVPGVDVIAVGPAMELYSEGRRRTLPPLVFGLGVFWHLLRHGRRYDVVHTGSMPYFPLLAALVLRRRGTIQALRRLDRGLDPPVLAEVRWPHPRRGRVAPPEIRRAQTTQGVRLRTAPRRAAPRARTHGRGDRARRALPGGAATAGAASEPLVVFAGRHIPEKGVLSLVPALAKARERIPELRAELYGDGPDRKEVLSLLERHGLNGSVSAPGFVDAARVEKAIGRRSV